MLQLNQDNAEISRKSVRNAMLPTVNCLATTPATVWAARRTRTTFQPPNPVTESTSYAGTLAKFL